MVYDRTHKLSALKDISSCRVATAPERKRAALVSGIRQLVPPIYAGLFKIVRRLENTNLHKGEYTFIHVALIVAVISLFGV